MPFTERISRLQPLSRKFAAVLLLLAVLLTVSSQDKQLASAEEDATKKIYLPIAADSYRSAPPILLGVYSPNYLGTQDEINRQLKALDSWAGKGVSIAGLFLDFNDPNPGYNVRTPLELLWGNGYTAFVNLMTQRSAAYIAQGKEDGNIREVASAFAYWMALAKPEKRTVFLAPLPEANITDGNTYGGDPNSYKSAFWRIQDIFSQEFSKQKVSPDSLVWVFAPNGVDEPGRPTFEAYYPGQDHVDIVAFSSYNWGYCVGWEYDEWQLGPQLFQPSVQRMHKLAPSKPIFISQTATTSEYPYPNHYDPAKKSSWFVDVYPYLGGLDGVRAVLYFNIDAQCDWKFFRKDSLHFDGYKQAVSSSVFGYLPPIEMASTFSQP